MRKLRSYNIGDDNSEKISVIRFLRKSSDSWAKTSSKLPAQNPILKTALKPPTTILLMPSRNPKFTLEKTKTRATSPVRVAGLHFAMPTKSCIRFYDTKTINYLSL